MKNVFVKM